MNRCCLSILRTALLGALLLAGAATAAPAGSAFTYQGELDSGGLPLTGTPNLLFRLYDAMQSGNQIGSAIAMANYPVVAGLLTIDLDFGAGAFNGEARWLEITVDGNVLAPRQLLSATPYALRALGVADGAVGAAQIDPTQVQARVGASCSAGSAIRAIGTNGSVQCESAGSGTVTGVTAGAGLSGGGSSGNVSLAIANAGVVTAMLAPGAVGSAQLGSLAVTAGKFDPTQVQARVTSSCAAGSAIRQVNADGTVSCQAAGTLTGVAAGTGLSGGGSSGTVNLAIANGGVGAAQIASGAVGSAQIADASIGSADIDTSQVQARVGGSCAVGSAIRSIAADGSVTCDTPVAAALPPPRPAFSRADIDLPGTVGESSIALGVDGLGVIAWYNQFSNNLHVSHCADIACSAVSDVAVDGAGSGPTHAITINSQGRAVLSYEGFFTGSLKLATCMDTACSAATAVTVDAGPNVGRYSSLGINQYGNPVISYYDAANGNLKVAVCQAPDCSAVQAPVTLDGAANDVGQHSALLVVPGPSDPLIVVSYYDATAKALKVASCSAANCAAGSATVLDATTGAGIASSIMLGSDGLPLVAYWTDNGSNQGARVAHCSTPTCSSATITPLLGVSGYTLQQVYAANGADGLPLLSFHTGASPGLTLVHCADARCSAPTFVTQSSGAIVPADPIAYGFVIGSDGAPLFATRRSTGTNGNLGITHCSDPFCLPWRRGR